MKVSQSSRIISMMGVRVRERRVVEKKEKRWKGDNRGDYLGRRIINSARITPARNGACR